MIALLVLGCAPAPPPPPPIAPAAVTPKVALAAPWKLDRQDPDAVVARLGDGADGVRIQLARDERGRIPGVTVIHGGRTLELEDGTDRWPLVATGWADHTVSDAVIEVDGVDLFVRLGGPALKTLTALPEAPDDPAIAWIRVRPRGQDWRLIVTGLVTVSLPGDGLAAHGDDDGEIAMSTAWGTVTLGTDAPRHRSKAGPRWWFDTFPALDAHAPYPKTTITWKPAP
jgi:hypothetical protein